MSEKRFQSFEEFWPFYVGEHSKPTCRTLHFVGTHMGLLHLAGVAATGSPWFILTGLVNAYGFAWVGHFFIEKNRPATFKYPLWSLRGDFRMLGLMWRGRMTDEVNRVLSRRDRTQPEMPLPT